MDKNYDVCFFLPEISGGGAERVVCKLTSALAEQGYKVGLMLIQDRNRAYDTSEKIDIIQLPTGKNKISQKIIRIRFIRKFLKSNPNCTLVSFLYRTLVYSLFATVGLKNKWIVSERNNPYVTPTGRLNRFIRNIGFGFADRCVFQTIDAMNYFKKSIQKKGVVIPNPIPEIQPKRVPNDKHIIINACRFSKQKNLPMLVEAFFEIHKIHSDYKLELYGDGTEKDNLIQLIEKLDLKDCVIMPGFSSSIIDRFRNAEIFVSTSDYEGISNSMLEAMSVGLPVICTDCPIGGARMMIEHDNTGLLIPVGDKSALVSALLKLIENRDHAEALAENAIKKCNEYSMNNVVERWKREF